jgi:hypothetical protein
MMVELTKGALPWRTVTDRITVQAAKISARSTTRSEFLIDCPNEYGTILDHIDGLGFLDAPNYDKITGLLTDVSFWQLM